MNQEREKAVRTLLEFSDSLISINDRLRNFPWDFQGDGVLLSPAHITNVLHRFLLGQLSVSDVEEWANLIEGRDDVSFEENSKMWSGAIMYELANPYLTTPLTHERAEAIIAGAMNK